MSRFGETPNGGTLRFVSGASGARATLIAIGWNPGKARLARDAQAGRAFWRLARNFPVQVPFTCESYSLSAMKDYDSRKWRAGSTISK